MLPSIVISIATSGAASALGAAGTGSSVAAWASANAGTIGELAGGAATFAGIKGKTYNDAIQQGMTKEQASAYSTMVGASEAGLQYLIGGISKLGGGSEIGAWVEEKIAGLGGAYAAAAAKLAGSVTDEVIEENVQNYLDPLFLTLVTGEDYDAPGWQDFLETTLSTMLTVGVMEATEAGRAGLERRERSWAEKAIETFPEWTEIYQVAQDVQYALDEGMPISAKEFRSIIREVGVSERKLNQIKDGKLTVAEVLGTETAETGEPERRCCADWHGGAGGHGGLDTVHAGPERRQDGLRAALAGDQTGGGLRRDGDERGEDHGGDSEAGKDRLGREAGRRIPGGGAIQDRRDAGGAGGETPGGAEYDRRNDK